MSEWWTYTPADFLMFAPRTYWRLVERYNEAIWPLQILGVACGLALVALVHGNRAHRDRIIAGLIAGCWLWIASAFHLQRYAQINWAATWFAAAFALQALLLVIVGVAAGRIRLIDTDGRARAIASLVLVFAVLVYPLLAPLAGRPWSTAEVFGVAPDPTAIATVAVLALVRGRIRWLLLAVPLGWCAIATATLWVMEAREAVVVAAATLLALWPAARGAHAGLPAARR